MFRILVVDDDPSTAFVLREGVNDLRHRYEVDLVPDGVEALNYLYRHGLYVDALAPDLILLDINMPRSDGFETLSAIKTDPELCVIPVIMLSTSGSPQDVRRSYQSHANGYVQKPTDLDRFLKMIQAMEAFWVDFSILPKAVRPSIGNLQLQDSKAGDLSRPAREFGFGPAIAPRLGKENGRATGIDDSHLRGTGGQSRSGSCEEHRRLLEEFGETVRELVRLHEQQFLAIIDGDAECHRFDLLIHMANERKQQAKYAYIRHVETHGCTNTNALDKTRA